MRAHALCMRTHIVGMRMHTRAQKCRFRVLAILFVLISFNHMFRSC